MANKAEDENMPEKLLAASALQVAAAVSGAATDGIRGTVADVWGGLIGDRIRQWRQRNLIASLEKTAEYLKSRGIDVKDAKVLPEGVLYSIFDGASKEEDPSLQDFWAGLLGTYAAGDEPGLPVNVVTGCLAQMSADDARLLVFLSDAESRITLFQRQLRDLRGLAFDRIGKASDAEERETFAGEVQDAVDKEVRDLSAYLEIRLKSDRLIEEQSREKAKENLFRLGLIRGKRNQIGKTRTHRWAPSLRSLHDPIEELLRIIDELQQGQDEFEGWAEEALRADEQVFGRFEEPLRAEILWELTEFGKRFLDAVGTQFEIPTT